MKAGELNCWVTIERPAPATGTASDVSTLTWSKVCSCWAKLRNTGGLELPVGEQMESRLWWQISIRHRNGLDATMRVTFGARIFNITAVYNVDEQNEQQQILAWEGLGIQ